jgi:hypothetical protein
MDGYRGAMIEAGDCEWLGPEREGVSQQAAECDCW